MGARGRQAQAFFAAVEKPDIQLGFQCLNLRGNGGLGDVIKVSCTGQIERFCDESAKYLPVSREVLKQTDSQAFMVFDQTVYDTLESNGKFQTLLYGKKVEKFDTLEELADFYGIDKANLVETVAHYTELVRCGADTDFNRPYYYMKGSDMSTAPYYGIKTNLCLHTAWGGIRTDIDARVLRADGTAITGLYAAGECTANMVQGNGSATQTAVWGRIAVETAMDEVIGK